MNRRRRQRRRERQPESHSHEDLPLIPDDGPEGKWKRQPCPKCRPQPAPRPFIGGQP